MARDSFIFYRSFLEAIKCMPSEVQAEIYPAIVEYALNGKEPKGLSDIAKGVFILIKPVMDANNARSEGGKKGKKFGKLGGRPAKDRAVSSANTKLSNKRPKSQVSLNRCLTTGKGTTNNFNRSFKTLTATYTLTKKNKSSKSINRGSCSTNPPKN